MDDLERRILAYASKAARTPFSYETGHDCAQGFVGGWVFAETGQEVARPWRGSFRTALGCYRLVRRSGGLVAIMDDALGRVGIVRTCIPALGDVGAVMMQTERAAEPVGAIMGLDGWLSLTGRGIRSTQADRFVAAWSVPHG